MGVSADVRGAGPGPPRGMAGRPMDDLNAWHERAIDIDSTAGLLLIVCSTRPCAAPVG